MRNGQKVEIVAALLVCLFLPGCGNLGATGGNRAQFLVTLSSLSPSTVMAGGPPFILTVNGSNLTGGYATLVWNGGQQINSVGAGSSTESTQATFQIDASLIANPGIISIAVVDGINNNQLSNALTLTISPPGPTACALFGTYEFLFTSAGGGAAAGAFGVDANGNVIGEEDVAGTGNSVVVNLPITGNCNGATPNEGTLALPDLLELLPRVTSTYSFVLEKNGGGLPRGKLANASGSGVLVGTNPDAVLANGDYIFGVLGEDPYGGSGVGTQMAIAGRFTNSNGTLSAGVGDVNDGGSVTQSTSVSGSSLPSSQPDLWPRVALNLSIGGLQTSLVAYPSSSGSAFAVATVATPFPHSSGEGVGYVAGFISPQSNAGSYTNSSLNAPFVFTTLGVPPPLCCWSTNPSSSDTTIGLASGFDSNAGTLNLLFDNVSGGAANLNQTITGATYAVSNNGRATVSDTSGANPLNYVYYLDNANDGYILGLSNAAEFGFFQPQASGPFDTASINSTFASGTLLPETPASPNLVTEVTLNNGNLTASTPSGALSGTYSVAASGRGTASVNLPVFGGTDLVLYVIDPQSVLLMGSDSTASDAITLMHF